MTDDCLFCKVRDGQIPAKKLYEDEDVLAFDDINPQAPVHLLVIPKLHIATANEITPEHDTCVAKLLRIGATLAKERGLLIAGHARDLFHGIRQSTPFLRMLVVEYRQREEIREQADFVQRADVRQGHDRQHTRPRTVARQLGTHGFQTLLRARLIDVGKRFGRGSCRIVCDFGGHSCDD